MTVDIILTVIAVAFAFGIAAPATWWTLTRRAGAKNSGQDPEHGKEQTWFEAAVRRRLLVHTRDGQTIEGSVVRIDSDGIVLEPAKLVDGGHELAGQVWVPRDRVAWLQHPGG